MAQTSLTSYRRQMVIWGYIFVAPALAAIIIFVFVPFLVALWNSLFTGFGRNMQYVGIRNYVEMFTNPRTWSSLGTTLILTLSYTAVSGLLGFLAASWVTTRAFRAGQGFMSAIFMPYIITPAISALVWQYMYNQQFGIINFLLNAVGIGGVAWLTQPATAMLSLIIVQIWFTAGYNTILFASGMQAIPQDYYESAELDGASTAQQRRHITLPLIIPTLVFVLIISLMSGFTHSFVLAQIITDGGPYGTTEVMMLYIYKTAFENFDIPKSNAITLFMFAILFTVSYSLQRWQDRAYSGIY
jgi:ABC-type sugar transport system permease subunit